MKVISSSRKFYASKGSEMTILLFGSPKGSPIRNFIVANLAFWDYNI